MFLPVREGKLDGSLDKFNLAKGDCEIDYELCNWTNLSIFKSIAANLSSEAFQIPQQLWNSIISCDKFR